MAWFRFAEQSTPPPAPDEDRASVGEEVNKTLLNLLPWAISLLFHAGLVLLTSFVIWTSVAEEEEDKQVIPSTNLQQMPSTPMETPQTETDTDVESPQTESIENTQSESQTNLNETVDNPNQLIAAGAAGSASSAFDRSEQRQGQTSVQVFGQRGNAKKIIFLIDASGSLIDTLPFVIDELKKTVQGLSAQQKFTIIFYRGENIFQRSIIEVPVPRTGLKQATQATKETVSQWIDMSSGNIEPGGQATPVKAIREALRYRPELLVILSDDITGTGTHAIDQQRLLQEIERVNRGGTKINTIQFLYRDPLDGVPGKMPTLKLIAERTGGKYDFIDAQEVYQ